MTRRMMLGVCAAAMVAPAGAAARAAAVSRDAALSAARLRPNTLAGHAARRNLLFGTFVDGVAMDDAPYMSLVSREASMVYPWGMSPNVSRYSQDGFDFRKAERIVGFATAHGLAVAGGYMIVHGTEPKWITPATARPAALAELQLDVGTTMQHFAGQLDHWVVVNEALYLAHGNPYGLRNCTWLSSVGGDVRAGTDYVTEAFRAARRTDPSAVLVLNEYGIEADTADASRKRDALLVLLGYLRRAGLIDGLAIQSHLRGGEPFSAGVFDAFLDRVTGLGLKIVISEIDVIDADLPADTGARDAAVAQRVGEYLDVVLKYPQVIAIDTWGLSDKESWYNRSATPAALRRRDGLDSRPAIFDERLQPKPVYVSVVDALDAPRNS